MVGIGGWSSSGCSSRSTERNVENDRLFQSNYWTPFDCGALLTFHDLMVCRSR